MNGGPQLMTQSGPQRCVVRCHSTPDQKALEEVRQAAMLSRNPITCISKRLLYTRGVTVQKMCGSVRLHSVTFRLLLTTSLAMQ